MTRLFGSAASSSMMWEPTCPAPPVTRIVVRDIENGLWLVLREPREIVFEPARSFPASCGLSSRDPQVRLAAKPARAANHSRDARSGARHLFLANTIWHDAGWGQN